MVEGAPNALTSSVFAFLGFLLGFWQKSHWGRASPSPLPVPREDCECLFSGCSPDELRTQVETLRELVWWKGAVIVTASLLGAGWILTFLFLVFYFCGFWRRRPGNDPADEEVEAASTASSSGRTADPRPLLPAEFRQKCERASILDDQTLNGLNSLNTGEIPYSELPDQALQRRPRRGPARPSDYK